ncbi:MAG: hypothetical protein Ct9H300mP19_11640 [Dehalococcoidia bacterium]|nr:MAG: hypothetical protein Ct9H300mP19_11640 [Dehalococcoidia bacterium]
MKLAYWGKIANQKRSLLVNSPKSEKVSASSLNTVRTKIKIEVASRE